MNCNIDGLIQEINQDPFLLPMLPKVKRFSDYLDMTSKADIKVRAFRYRKYSDSEDKDMQSVEFSLGYDTRWSEHYRNNLLWRLYNLTGYYQKYSSNIPQYSLMITLTGSHDSPDKRNRLSKNNLGHMAFLEKFYHARKNQRQMINKWFPAHDYISMCEGHPTSGFIHAHNLYLLNDLPSDKVLSQIKEHWALKQSMGSLDRSIDIEIKEVKNFKDIISLVGYPMAYIGKNTSHGIQDWTKEDLVYNASIFWAPKSKRFGGIGHKIRTFQPSLNLSKIMQHEYSPDGDDLPGKNFGLSFVDSRLFSGNEPILLNKTKFGNYEDYLAQWYNFRGEIQE